jgi:hypothetical protein
MKIVSVKGAQHGINLVQGENNDLPDLHSILNM